jgi:hypothetical protein
LPGSHPAAMMLALADAVPAFSWSRSVVELMASGCFGGVIPDLVRDNVFPGARIRLAKDDVTERRALLKEYKWTVLRPILMRHDRDEYLAKASVELPTCQHSFASFLPDPRAMHVSLLLLDTCPGSWQWFRLWSVTRMTGRWPLLVYGGLELPVVLDACPSCGATEATVVHALCSCPATSQMRTAFCADAVCHLQCLLANSLRIISGRATTCSSFKAHSVCRDGLAPRGQVGGTRPSCARRSSRGGVSRVGWPGCGAKA